MPASLASPDHLEVVYFTSIFDLDDRSTEPTIIRLPAILHADEHPNLGSTPVYASRPFVQTITDNFVTGFRTNEVANHHMLDDREAIQLCSPECAYVKNHAHRKTNRLAADHDAPSDQGNLGDGPPEEISQDIDQAIQDTASGSTYSTRDLH